MFVIIVEGRVSYDDVHRVRGCLISTHIHTLFSQNKQTQLLTLILTYLRVRQEPDNGRVYKTCLMIV